MILLKGKNIGNQQKQGKMQLNNLYDVIVSVLMQLGVYNQINGIFDQYGLLILLKLCIYLLEAFILFGFVAVTVLAVTYLERKILADIQIRLGPMETGGRRFHGILQPIADGIKLFLKEDIIPARIDKCVYIIAPVVIFASTFLLLAVIPFNEFLVIANPDLSLLFILAISTIVPLGVIMGGWASGNKYALLSALRSAAQMMTYEIPLVLAVLGVVLVTGSLNLVEIVNAQDQVLFGILPNWNIFIIPMAFIIFFIGSLAEIGRIPFDLLEAESEIVTGYHIEYGGMRFAFLFLAEYAHLFIACALITLLFLGGWNGPFLPGIAWFFIKTYLLIYVFIWLRGTLPRVRIDQLLALGWKFLIPLGLLNMGVIGLVMLI